MSAIRVTRKYSWPPARPWWIGASSRLRSGDCSAQTGRCTRSAHLVEVRHWAAGASGAVLIQCGHIPTPQFHICRERPPWLVVHAQAFTLGLIVTYDVAWPVAASKDQSGRIRVGPVRTGAPFQRRRQRGNDGIDCAGASASLLVVRAEGGAPRGSLLFSQASRSRSPRATRTSPVAGSAIVDRDTHSGSSTTCRSTRWARLLYVRQALPGRSTRHLLFGRDLAVFDVAPSGANTAERPEAH